MFTIIFHNEKIQSIEPIKYNGPVYNFQVEEDESYAANGIIVHNCRCIVLPLTEELTGSMNDSDNADDTEQNEE